MIEGDVETANFLFRISGERPGPQVYYEGRDPYNTERHIPQNTMRYSVAPDANAPAYTRVIQPRRQVIVLE